METATTPQPVVLSAEAIAALPITAFGPLPGVTHRELWRTDTSMAGILTVEPGHHLGRHTHRANHHHMWVLEGRAVILGTEVGPGTYVHIPSGVQHDIEAATTDGCTVFYLYLRHAG